MSSSLTSRLKLFKADPGTGEPVDVAKLNQALDKIDAAISPGEITSTTRPTSPFPNQLIRESDTRRIYVWNDVAGSWDQLVMAGPVQNAGSVEFERASTSAGVIGAKVTGDTIARFASFADGKMELGPGNAARDVNLYRAAANVLATDDVLRVSGDYISGSNEGVNAPATTSGSNTTTSSSYVAMAGTGAQISFSFLKRFPASQTRLKVHMSASMWVSGTFPTAAMFGVQINSVDTDIFRLQIDASAGNNTYGQGTGYVTGLAAGSFTVTGRWKRATGTGTLNRDTGNWLTIMVEEVSV